jgi:hypothetical protein
MSQFLVAIVVFGGDLPWDKLDVDRAAVELQQAGYAVARLPDKLAARLVHPLDDFIEAVIEGPNDDHVIDLIMQEIDTIVRRCGGLCFECGPLEPDHVPFADFLADGLLPG